MAPREQLTKLVKAVDAQGIEFARDEVRDDDIPGLVEWYWTLSEWPQRLALVDLIQDHYHSSMDKLLLHVLGAPGDGNDWVDLPKAVAIGKLSEKHDNFMTYYNDREALGVAIDEVLEARGMTRKKDSVSRPKTEPVELPSDPEDALWIAATTGQAEKISPLTALVSPNLSRDGEPILIQAIMRGHKDIALALLLAGADSNAFRSTGGQTALFWAASMGFETVVLALLDRGAVVDATDQYNSTPLINAASSGHLQVVHLLLSRGANPMQLLSDGRSVLNMSVRGGKAEILAALIEAGADPNETHSAFTPLAFACFEGTTAMVRLLIEHGADVHETVDYASKRKKTPLMLAAQANKVEMVRALLEAGARVDALDNGGQSAADYATGSRGLVIRELLDESNVTAS